jgi:hypothetical protein
MRGYAYRISPDDPYIVQVRRLSSKRQDKRVDGWNTYYEAYTPEDARRILAMLSPDRVEAKVQP